MMRLRPLLALALALPLLAHEAEAGDRQPVVVELFTSQGCSSCPPVNANLAKLAKKPGVLALSFGVTYWDKLGWPDTFGRPEYTERQRVYLRPLGEAGPFTPQIVVDGRRSIVGHDLAEIEGLVSGASREAGPEIALEPAGVAIAAATPPAAPADVWLVRYDPRTVEVPVRRGENGGRTLPHTNVVHELIRLGGWSGQATRLAIPTGAAGRKTAILVQARQGGPILAAVSD